MKLDGFKVTFETNKEPIQMKQLFSAEIDSATERVKGKYDSQTANVFTVQYWNGNMATVLVSKNTGKYRIQGSSFYCLWMLAKTVLERLKNQFSKDNSFKVAYSDVLPLKDFFDVVEKHFQIRSSLVEIENSLNDHSQQFRSIQKRLLLRFKDKSPPSLNHLEILLQNTYQIILDLGSKVKQGKKLLMICSSQLSCATELL